MNYLRHPAWLWLEKHDKKKLPKHDKNTQAMFAAGFLFETYAEKEFPEAQRLGFSDYNEYKELAAVTRAVVDNPDGARTIIQAKFETDDIACISDVVHFDGTLVDIYEIKSSTSAKPEHILDLAFQAEVLRRNGYTVRNVTVLFVNNDYVRNGKIDHTELVSREDVTDKVLEIEALTNIQIADALSVMRSTTCPDISPSHAKLGSLTNWMVVYRNLVDVPEYSIYDLAAPGTARIAKLEELGIKKIEDIPESSPLTSKQELQVLATKKDMPIINRDAILAFMSEITFPLYFLDYETYNGVIPYFDGQKPYQQIPFQYSLHILDSPDAELRYVEYLHEDATNPISPLSDSLQANIGDAGAVITWNMSFEKSCNTRMGELFPEYGDFYAQVNNRVIDLAVPFADDMYVDKRFVGRYSIKYVLPVLVPELSYKALRIQEGGSAQRLWMEAVLDGNNEDGKQQILDDLVEYCELDTLAMVEIYRKLITL